MDLERMGLQRNGSTLDEFATDGFTTDEFTRDEVTCTFCRSKCSESLPGGCGTEPKEGRGARQAGQDTVGRKGKAGKVDGSQDGRMTSN